MPPDSEVEESQIVQPDHDIVEPTFSPPPESQSSSPVQASLVPQNQQSHDATTSEDSTGSAIAILEHDSISSHVHENQSNVHEDISHSESRHISHQDSLGSVIHETQFVALVPEIQESDDLAQIEQPSPISELPIALDLIASTHFVVPSNDSSFALISRPTGTTHTLNPPFNPYKTNVAPKHTGQNYSTSRSNTIGENAQTKPSMVVDVSHRRITRQLDSPNPHLTTQLSSPPQVDRHHEPRPTPSEQNQGNLNGYRKNLQPPEGAPSITPSQGHQEILLECPAAVRELVHISSVEVPIDVSQGVINFPLPNAMLAMDTESMSTKKVPGSGLSGVQARHATHSTLIDNGPSLQLDENFHRPSDTALSESNTSVTTIRQEPKLPRGMAGTTRSRKRMKQPFPEVIADVHSPYLPTIPPRTVNKKSKHDHNGLSKISEPSILELVPDNLPSAASVVAKEVYDTEKLPLAFNNSHKRGSGELPNLLSDTLIQQNGNISQQTVPVRASAPVTRCPEYQTEEEPSSDRHKGSISQQIGVPKDVNAQRHSNIVPLQGQGQNLQQPAGSVLQHGEADDHLNPEHSENDTHQSAGNGQKPQPQSLASEREERRSDALRREKTHSVPIDDGYITIHPESRPQSRCSGHGKAMTRPFPEEEPRHPSMSESTSLHVSSPARTKNQQKSKFEQENWSDLGAKSNTTNIAESQRRKSLLKPASEYHKFLLTGQAFLSELDEYEKQKVLVEAQKVEIANLQRSGTENQKQIKFLEEENRALSKKIKRLEASCQKYKTHMNDVVNYQKELMAEARKLRRETAVAGQEAKELSGEIRLALVDSNAHHKKHATAIKDAANDLKDAAQEQRDLRSEIVNMTRSNELLKADLDKTIIELGRERHKADRFQKQLIAGASSHNELVQLLKNSQTKIVDELVKDGGILGRFLESGSSTLAKVEELSTLINNLNNNEPGIPQALIALLEDVYTRIENKFQSAEDSTTTVQERNAILFNDLDERIDQVRLDQETKDQLNNRVWQLREANGILTANLNGREIESQGMAARIDELGQDLIGYREQLSAKSSELTAILALSKDDAQLKDKLRDLGSANDILHDQIHALELESNVAKESTHLLQEASLRFQGKVKELEDENKKYQALLDNAQKEKDSYIATCKKDIEEAKREVAKTASVSKAEESMRNNALISNIEQQRNEAEFQLKLATEKLQGNQDESLNNTKRISELQKEVTEYREKFAQQAAQLKDLKLQNSTPEQFNMRIQSIESALGQLADFRLELQVAKNDTAEKLDHARHNQNEVEEQLRNVDKLQNEKEQLQAQITTLQSRYNDLCSSTTRHLTRDGDLEQGGSVDLWATTDPLCTPPKIPPSACSLQTLLRDHPSPDVDSKLDIPTTLIIAQYPTPQEALEETLGERSGVSGIPVMHSVREAAVQNGTLAATNSHRVRTPCRDSDDTHAVHAVYTAAVQPIQEPDAPAMTQNTPKSLRVANRKGSNVIQQAKAQDGPPSSTRSASCTRSTEYRQSTVTRTTHRTEETTYNIHAPEESIIPFSAMSSTRDQTSSPLTDVEPMLDLLGSVRSQEGLTNAYHKTRKIKASGMSSGKTLMGQMPGMSSPSKSSRSASGSRARDENHFSDHEAVENHKQNSRRGVGHILESSITSSSRLGVPVLKSALKKTSRNETSNASIAPSGAIAMANSTRTLKNKPPTLGVNRRVLTANTMGGGSDYNRVARGAGKIASMKIDAHGFLQSPTNQQSNEQIQISPLIPAPKQNNQKRKASENLAEDREYRGKGLKAPRISFLPATSRKIIPDSQENQYRY